MKKLTEEELKNEASRLVEKYVPPADALPGEDRFSYEERKRKEVLSQMATAPQAQTPVSVWGRKQS